MIEKITVNSQLNIFANQIKLFDKFSSEKNFKDKFPIMSIDNSVNYVKVMSEWKEILFKNESYQK